MRVKKESVKVVLKLNIKKNKIGLPQGLSGKESTYQCKRHGFDPQSRKIPHSMEKLSPFTTAIKPVL